MWRSVAHGLLDAGSFAAFAGDLLVALLVEVEPVYHEELTDTIDRAIAEEGFRTTRSGDLPDERDISWAIHATPNPCHTLGMLTEGGSWLDRRHGLTDAGKASPWKRSVPGLPARGRATGTGLTERATPIYGPEPWERMAGGARSHRDP